MSAFERLQLDDYLERIAKGQALTREEKRRYKFLDKRAREEWENAPPPRWEGGHPDMF